MSQPPPSPSSSGNFPILAISLLGILTTTFLLLSYYVFVLRCCLIQHNFHGFLGRRLSRRYWRSRSSQLMAYATGASENRGLDESAIQALPTLRYRKGTGGPDEKASQSHECAVCLNEFREEERIRLLPNCLHTFHLDCIDAWLQTNANCPLCRSSITSPAPLPADHLMTRVQGQEQEQDPQTDQYVVIEVGDDGGNEHNEAASVISSDSTDANASARKAEQMARPHVHASSMGDECIDVTRGAAKDELFHIQPIRRSFSMDSGDWQLRATVQKALQQNPPRLPEVVNDGESSSSGSGRFRRQFLSFGRSSRNAVLPVHFEL